MHIYEKAPETLRKIEIILQIVYNKSKMNQEKNHGIGMVESEVLFL